MNKWWGVLLIGAAGAISSCLTFIDQSQAREAESTKAPDPTATGHQLLYKPPLLGAPKLRIGGGGRGVADHAHPVLQVLAPKQSGLTTMAQPTLYWYLDRATPHTVEITIMEEMGVSPLVRELLAGPVPAGLHAFRLATQDKRLELDKDYEWFVAIIPEPAQRSKDIISSGGLALIPVSTALHDQLQVAKTDELGLLYAGAGLWYDAINALAEGQNRGPKQAVLRGQFTSILQQEEITGVQSDIGDHP
jgi:hypothetical protein